MKLNRPYRRLADLLAAALALLVLPWPSLAQPLNPEIRLAVREDSRAVYVYHTALPPIGQGFNIYRRGADDEEFRQLNVDPVRGAASGAELRALLGTLYVDVERATRQTSADGTLAKLLSDVRTANLLSFTFPKVAEALGRLYIDQTAASDAPVTYRIEFVDALDVPTGIVLEKTELILPQKPVPPTRLRAQNRGNRVTLFWQYISPNENEDDKVIRFEAFRIDPTTGQHRRLHDHVVLRNNALFEYALTYEAPTTGQTEQLYVRSIDISGQASEPSVVLRYPVMDVDPPRNVIEVHARRLPGRRIQVAWSPTDPAGIAGYHLYRSSELMDARAYARLNREMLAVSETVFNDTLPDALPGPVYYYRVTAVDEQGNEGPMSTAAMAVVDDEYGPPAPAELTGRPLDTGAVALSWSAPAMPEDFDTFVVLRRPMGAGAPEMPVRINPDRLTTTEWVDDGLAGAGFMEGLTYRYSVLGVDRAGNQSEAATVDVRLPDRTPPGTPGGVQAIVDNASRIAVFWNPPPSPDVMSYIVYRRESGTSRLEAFPVDRRARRYEDTTVEAGTTYEYWVTAADSAGNESPAPAPFRIQMRDDTPPRRVRNARALWTAGAGVTLHWEPVAASDLAGYRVESAGELYGPYRPAHDELLLDTMWTDPDGRPGRWYRVYAVDTSGNESKASRPVSARPPEGQ